MERGQGTGYWRALAIGAVAGMRSMTAPAVVSGALPPLEGALSPDAPDEVLRLPQAPNVLRALAVGEIAADKTPVIPDRISPVPLAGRAVLGALSGAALCRQDGGRPEAGAALGAAGAVASTFAMYYLRKRAGERLRVADPVLAVVEDALAVGCGLLVVRAASARKDADTAPELEAAEDFPAVVDQPDPDALLVA